MFKITTHAAAACTNEEKGYPFMANRVFQSVIYQMKDAIDRVVGVVDETGAVISCSELNLIGEVREGFMAERLTAGDRFVRDGYTYQQFSSAKHNDYAVFVTGLISYFWC